MSTSNINQDIYKNHPLVEFIKKTGKPLKYRTHECAVNLGEKSNKVFFIKKGGFICQNYDKHSEQFRTINFYLQNFHPLMTVLTSYFANKPSGSQLKAIKNSEVLVVKKEDLENEVLKDEVLQKAYLKEKEYIILKLDEFRTKQITLSSKNLYNYLLTDCNEVVRNVPSKYIAEFMGVTAEWLSKIR